MLSFLDRLQPLALFALRVGLGAIMIAHGKEKVFGGMAKHIAFLHSIGVPAPTLMGYLSAGAEFIGGILLVVGLFTRFAAFATLVDMLVAIFKVHLKNGFTGQGNYQFPLALAVIAFALIFYGAGEISLDWAFGKKGR
jgi:putative oxidoreductase